MSEFGQETKTDKYPIFKFVAKFRNPIETSSDLNEAKEGRLILQKLLSAVEK